MFSRIPAADEPDRIDEWPPERIEREQRDRDRARATVVPVADLMATPAGRDEVGTPDHAVCECPDCGALYREAGAHRCLEGWTDE